jgi:hypothetical protein
VAKAPRWLRLLLTGAVIGPAAVFVAWAMYGVHGTDEWSNATDASGFALCGLFVLVPVAVGVVWLAARTFARRDGEGHAAIAGGCGLGVGLLTISLGEAAAVGMGLKDGQVPLDVLAGVGGAWLYFIAVGVGHWHLSRALPWRSRADKLAEPGAAPDGDS